MIVNFLKITLRNLWKNRGYSFLNIFGLAIGIACAGLIFLWVENELSYDQFIPKKDRLFYVMENQTYQGKVRTFNSTPVPFGPAVVREIPGIAATCRVHNNTALFSLGDKSLYENGAYVDSTIFGMFSLSFLEGNGIDAFRQPTNIVITEKVARHFFGGEKAIGKQLTLNNKSTYTVSGVIGDFPQASAKLRWDWMIPLQSFYPGYLQQQADNWGSNSTSTYVELAPGTSVAAVNARLKDYIATKKSGAIAKCFLFSANDWHLRAHFEDGKQDGGTIEYVNLFIIIAWIILLIACINFMNLATARSERRAREVGVRKVLGAARYGLIGQFIGESIFLSALSVALGVLLISLLMPAFAALAGERLALDLLRPSHLFMLVAITLICGLVAGSYPALYLSSFNPIYVFKGIRIKGGGAAFVRRGLVVMQFTVSIILIISTVIIYQQLEHIRHRDLGYDKDNLVTMNVVGNMKGHFGKIRQDLLATGVIGNAALNSFNMLDVGNNGSGASWAGKDPNQDILVSYRGVSPGYFATAGMRVLEGRDFREDLPLADSSHAIINQTLAAMMGKGSAIGKQINFGGGGSVTVVGVVKDFIFGDMYGKPDPVMFSCDTSDARLMYVRIKPGVRADEALAKMAAVMKKDNPAYPFQYAFVDETFAQFFTSEALLGVLSRLFAVLAILISCLGLFGLSAYTAERRTKEIGIRKVLGASVTGITGLLSREFLQLIFLSAVIAFPVTWLAMSHWLRQFAYRVNIEWWIFLAGGVAAMGIALVTISFQSVRAALMNPVKSLRAE
jgi:putative ABC transport system permease protein